MKTVVEWLYDNLKSHFEHDGDLLEVVQMSFNIAKEKEKHQRQEDTNYGYSQGWDDGNQNNEPMKPEIKDLKTKV
jgi:hypothetical protein